MALLLTNMDTEWIKTQYPELIIDFINNKIEGKLSFKIDYDGYKVNDHYDISVEFNQLDTLGFPKVREISGRIYTIAKKHKIESGDLHINPDRSFCIAIEGEERSICQNGFTFQEFFENAIEKFLFQMSYFEREGEFPWGQYAHGHLGHVEYYSEGKITIGELINRLEKVEIMQVMLVNRQSICLCGSGKKIRKCHRMVFRGINKMKEEFRKKVDIIDVNTKLKKKA